MHYRLGLDLGTNSIGWCAIKLKEDNDRWEACAFLDWGVRIFDDGREPSRNNVPGESSAVQRRTARGMRRRYDRILMRKKSVISALIKHRLMPEDGNERKKLEQFNPLDIRAKALTQKVEPYELGRALFHLQQRRGFKSNRKEARNNEETSSLKLAAAKLEEQLCDQQTLGQYLYERAKRRQSTRFRARAEGNKTLYDFYPTRNMVEKEFNRLWGVQQQHYPEILTDQAYTAIHRAIFFQRKLKPQPKGKCSLLPHEERMAWAMPIAQRFRIAKEIANLRLLQDGSAQGKLLSDVQRETLYDALCLKSHLTFGQIRKLLELEASQRFNLESENRKRLEGDKTAHIMREDKKGARFPGWDELSIDKQDMIISRIICDDPDHEHFMEDEELMQWLTSTYSLTPDQAEKVITAPIPSGHAKYGETVIRALLKHMREQGCDEFSAITSNGWTSVKYDGQILESLPYYGTVLSSHVVQNTKASDPMVREYGRVGNPTVHIALNQVKRLMNTLKQRYGCWPQEIVVEVARHLKKGRKEIAEIEKAIGKNTKLREQWRQEIAGVLGVPAETVSIGDLAKMKLWHELAEDPTQRQCVFTGHTISIEALLSDQIEIEHILPYSLTMDNTSANKTLAMREANRIKGNRTPYEAFKDLTGDMTYEKLLERSAILPKSKQWRFKPDAMERFIEKGDFAARQLNDTHYIAKLTKEYLCYACEQGDKGVTTTPGTLTGLLRKSWGLHKLFDTDEAKDRNDHRHHAVDALVIAMTTRSMIQSVANASKHSGKEQQASELRKHIRKHIPAPWQSFEHAEIQRQFDDIIVSHKPDHGTAGHVKSHATSGRLHEDTYYGLIGDADTKGKINLVHRVPLTSLTTQETLGKIRDKELREQIQIFADQYDGSVEKAVKSFAESPDHPWTGIKRVRIITEKSTAAMVPVKTTKDGTPWKMAQGGSNQRAEIYCPKSGKMADKWQIEVIRTFDANQSGFTPHWRQEYPEATLLFTLHGGDMVAFEKEGQTIIARVKKMNSNGRVYLLPHQIAKDDINKYSYDFSSAAGMQKANLRRLYVEIDGSIYDPVGKLTTTYRRLAS